jgi:3-deoxy-7-phosphoheptulonate synthase
MFQIYLLLFLPFVVSLKSPFDWNINSWKTKTIYQNVLYPNNDILNEVTTDLQKSAPLIFAGEAESLKKELKKVSKGEAFLLMGGDCAETFREFSVENVMNTYRILLQMTLIFMYGMSKPVVKIGRMAGQFAKPRSEIYETKNNVTLFSYRGDIINSEEFEESKRIPDPKLMMKAYSQSVQTMNLIRALSEGGYADIERIKDWNLNFVKYSESYKKYDSLSNNVNKALSFLKSIGLDKIEESKRAKFYTAHESLLLPYESALTRKDSISLNYYACSAHMLWIGERTRQLDGAHVEFARGLENPIGIKISDNFVSNELESLIRTLNPTNEDGKIVLITRMGKNISKKLPVLVDMINRRKLNVIWICDPMHGNTVKLQNGIKTRYIEDIKEEYTFFHNYLKKNNIFPGGIHLEMTGRDVTECIDKNNNKEFIDNMITHYESSCDPRLSASQCLDLAFYISSLE